MSRLSSRVFAGLFRATASLWWMLFAGVLLHSAAAPVYARDNSPQTAIQQIAVDKLPPEARTTLALIKKGGPFPYKKDGVVFGNFEKQLPVKERGYYHEYTVPTPKARDRGARRIVTGRGGEYYYSADHYKSFRRIRE